MGTVFAMEVIDLVVKISLDGVNDICEVAQFPQPAAGISTKSVAIVYAFENQNDCDLIRRA